METGEVVHRSRVISATGDPSFKVQNPTDTTDYDIEIGSPSTPVIKSLTEDQQVKLKELFGSSSQDDIHPSDLIGRSYLQPVHNDDGTRYRCEVVQALKEHEEKLGESKKGKYSLLA